MHDCSDGIQESSAAPSRMKRLRAVPGLLVATAVVIVFSAPALAQSAWLVALKAKDYARIEHLVGAGANVNERFADGKSALMIAGKSGKFDLVEKLLHAGAEVNAVNRNGGTALMFSAISGDLPTIRLLLEHGAAVDAVGANLWGAMMVAAVKGHAHVVDELLNRGAEPNLADVYGWTPLMRAANRNRQNTVRRLLSDPRTDIGHRDDDGATALHRAAEEGHLETVELLIGFGADVNALDANDRTAAMRAELAQHTDVALRLRQVDR
jgi:ankyrin repeat protein